MFWTFLEHYIAGNTPSPTLKSRTAFNKRSSVISDTQKHNYDAIARTVLSFGNDIVCVMDNNLECSYLSENWYKTTHIAVKDSLASGFKSRLLPADIFALKSFFKHCSSNDNYIRLQITHADEKPHWCELRVTAKDNRQNICLIRCVNELVCAEINFEKARFEADMASKSRSEFLANMSHELRTPLNAIIGFAQMMENEIYGEIGHPKYNDYINNIQKSGMVLLSKINDLLEIADINSGKMHINDAEYDLISIIKTSMEFHSNRAFANAIQIRECLPVKPVMVRVDRIRIVQVINNILCNAIKYSPSGETVDIYCEKRKDGGVNVVVEDKGNGIAPSHLHHMLTAFDCENSFFSRNRDCVGLGLAISQEIIKLHQGKIEIESEKGKGTVLRVMLPPERTAKNQARKVKQLKGSFEEL